jgi:hypothetical protein
MPQVGFEFTIPVFERAKTVHALDRVATVLGTVNVTIIIKLSTEMTITLERMPETRIREQACYYPKGGRYQGRQTKDGLIIIQK